jgi:hypothetical protein
MYVEELPISKRLSIGLDAHAMSSVSQKENCDGVYVDHLLSTVCPVGLMWGSCDEQRQFRKRVVTAEAGTAHCRQARLSLRQTSQYRKCMQG